MGADLGQTRRQQEIGHRQFALPVVVGEVNPVLEHFVDGELHRHVRQAEQIGRHAAPENGQSAFREQRHCGLPNGQMSPCSTTTE